MNSFLEFVGSLVIGLGGGLFALLVSWYLVERIIKLTKAHASVLEFILRRKEFERWYPSRWELQDAFYAAEDFEDWLGRNAGDNSDWPVRMTVGDERTAEELTHRLNRLKQTIAAYRKKNPLP